VKELKSNDQAAMRFVAGDKSNLTPLLHLFPVSFVSIRVQKR